MNPAAISLDPASTAIPARRQIFEQLRAALVAGTLQPGAELPSVRRLAVDLGIHFNTVAGAYRLLAEEGWIEIAHGKTARVLKRGKPPAPEPEEIGRLRGRLRNLVAEMRSRGLSRARIVRELASAGKALE